MLEDFSLGLSAAIVRNADKSMVEASMNQGYKLVNRLDALGGDFTLQLYSWYAYEALKARFIKERYP